jgi:hypothetical protein
MDWQILKYHAIITNHKQKTTTMLNAKKLYEEIELEVEGQYTVLAKSDDGQYLNVQNNEDGSTFPIKVSTFKRKVDSKEYTIHEDGSFSSTKERKTMNITWV